MERKMSEPRRERNAGRVSHAGRLPVERGLASVALANKKLNAGTGAVDGEVVWVCSIRMPVP